MGQPTKSWVPTYCSFSSCKILLKLHGLHDLFSLALGLTLCSMKSPGKVSDAHGTLKVLSYLPHYYSGAVPGFILILPTIFLLAFQTLWNRVYSLFPHKGLEFVKDGRGTEELAKTGQFPGEGRH